MKKILIASLLFPPLGLVLLWRSFQVSLRLKFLTTAAIALYSVIYLAAVTPLFLWVTGLEVEWRGARGPVLTWHKTHPNYDAVEASRRVQPRKAAPPISAATRVDWPGFRGRHGDGCYDQTPIATHWPAGGLRPLWKQPIGGGYGSFAVAGGRAFTIEQRREQEAVTAYDLETGLELWATAYPAFFSEALGGEGPRATPFFSEGKVYSLGGMGDLLCLDAASGSIVWRLNILTNNDAPLLKYGMSPSPLVVNDKVIVEAGGPKGRCIVAYDKLTGKPIWHALDDKGAYATPMLVSLAGHEQLLVVSELRVVGVQVQDGASLWMTPWIVNERNRDNAQPVLLGTNRFLLSASYGTGCEAVEITRPGGRFEAKRLWHNVRLKSKFSSALYWQGFIYGLDEDTLTCLDAQTGERKWREGRYGYGQVLLADGFLIVLGADGQLALVKASPDRYEESGRFQAIEGKTWNYPALAGGKILVRNAVQMACFDLRPVK